jgi:hypothetical protein
MPVAVDEAELLVSELATNVVKHVGEGASATLILEWRGGRLRLEVHDKSQTVPSLNMAGCDEECGRGLHLLSSLALDWGAELTPVGKAVWCEVAVGTGPACLRVERAVQVLEKYQRADCALSLRGAARNVVLEESAIELIADLLHWTAGRGQDPDDFLDRVQMRYENEVGAA